MRRARQQEGSLCEDDDPRAEHDEREAGALQDLLFALAHQTSPLSRGQSARLRAAMEETFGPPIVCLGRGKQWRFETEDARGQRGLLKVYIPHDVSGPASVMFSPSKGDTWVDGSCEFSQTLHSVACNVEKEDDPTGGKAIAKALLADLHDESTS